MKKIAFTMIIVCATLLCVSASAAALSPDSAKGLLCNFGITIPDAWIDRDSYFGITAPSSNIDSDFIIIHDEEERDGIRIVPIPDPEQADSEQQVIVTIPGESDSTDNPQHNESKTVDLQEAIAFNNR